MDARKLEVVKYLVISALLGLVPGGSVHAALNGLRDSEAVQAINGLRDDKTAPELNGLADGAQLEAWVLADPANADILHYVVQCARPMASDIESAAGVFRGNFGLVPHWGDQTGMTDYEKTVLVACLGAMVNPGEQHVPVSVRGLGISLEEGEPDAFPFREGAFFAIKDAEGNYRAFTCIDTDQEFVDTSRTCGFGGARGYCQSVTSVWDCAASCDEKESDHTYQCFYEGQRVPTLTTYLDHL